MKIFVCLKQVPDTETRIQVGSGGASIDEAGIKWVINPYDEFAIEEALKIRDSKGGGQVIAISVGPKTRITESLRTAMAMGADEAIAIDCDQPLEPYWTAQALARAIGREGDYNAVFCGKLAIDDNASAVPQMVAEFLNVPHATVVSKLEAGGTWKVEREVEGGAREIIEIQGPCVLAANKGLNTPRYASLPGIMKAKKKPLKEVSLSDLDLQVANKVRIKSIQLPPQKPPVKMISGEPDVQVKELVRLLLEESKVL